MTNSSPDCVFTNGDVICNFSSVSAFSLTSFTVQVTVDQAGTITNTATVTTTDIDGSSANNSAEAVVTVSAAVSALIVSNTSPTNATMDVALDQAITVLFDQGIDGGTVSSNTFMLQGDQHGPYSGQFTVASNQVTYTQDIDYFPGELISVMV